MPQVATTRFGVLDYPEEAVLHFPSGIPAFESATRFLAVERPDASPIVFLQSLVHPELCFLSLPVETLEPRYRLAVCVEDLRALGLPEDRQPRIGDNLVCLAILTIPESGPATANLMAPVLIRRDMRIGLQAVQVECTYSHQHPLFPETEQREVRCS